MPQVAVGAVLSGVLAGSAISAAGVLTVGFSLSAFAGSLILGGLSYALSPKPKKPSSFNAASSDQPGTVAVRQSDLTRTIVYGNTRVVRGYAHMVSTNENKDLHLIVMLCQGELRAIHEVWLNDYAIPNDWIDADGNVTQGRYAGYLKIRKHLGEADQDADSVATANIPEWTSQHRLRGIAYLYMVLNKNQDVYPTGVPNISAIVDGGAIYDPRLGTTAFTTNIALMAYDYIKASYGFASAVDDIDISNISAQANICDEIVDVTHVDYTATAVDAATDIITLSGDLLSLEYGDVVNVSSGGSPDLLPAGLTEDTDYYVIPYQVKGTPRIMLAASLSDAMARTPINLTTAGSTTMTVTKVGEPRYHGAGEIDTANSLSDNLSNLVNSMAGRAINIAGQWTLLAGAWRSPTLNLGIEDMRGSGVSIKNCLSMSDSYNSVKGLFSGQVTNYQESDYPVAQYDTYIDQDLGILAPRDLNLPYTTRPSTAQRIAKIELFRGRQDIAFTCDFSMKAMQLQPGDVVGITMDRIGWDDKYFEVTEFALDLNENGITTKLTLRETAEAIYDWSAGEAVDYDPAPNTTLTDPFNVAAPSSISYNSRLVETTAGDSIYMLQLQWDIHPDAFVREYGDFEIQFKKTDDTDWLPGFFVDGLLTQTDVVAASAGINYDLRIRARNNLGVRSGWSTIYGATAGSSGGVTSLEDYGSVADAPGSPLFDFGSVADAPTITGDYGFVA